MTIEQFLARRRCFEGAVAISTVCLFTIVNATSRLMENWRDQQPEPAWVAWLMEGSSGLSLLLLIPLLLWFHSRLALTRENVLGRILWHLPAAIIFCLAHVGIFSFLRYVGMPIGGRSYVIDDPLWFEFLYELRKDVVTYALIILAIEAYQFILARLQGEASFVAEQKPVQKSYSAQFLVKMLQREYLVQVNDIQWVEAARNYVLLHCKDRSYPMRQTLSGMEKLLNPDEFMRVHRSAIVNLSRVVAVQSGAQPRQLDVGHGQAVPLSQSYVAEVNRRLADKTGPQ